jgi:hypothetical protein
MIRPRALFILDGRSVNWARSGLTNNLARHGVSHTSGLREGVLVVLFRSFDARVPHTSFLRVGPMLFIPGRAFAAVDAKRRVVIPRSPAKACCLRSKGGTTRNLLLAWECRNCRSLGRLGRPRDDNGLRSPLALLTK